jgi:predicted XRE-type DNA-binding protein
MSNTVIHRGSGNVYKDLGFPDAEEMQAKAMLVSRIMSIINKKKWSQEKAASVLGIKQPKISLLSRGQFSGFSLGKLINLLSRLNQDIEIVVKNRSSSKRHHVGHVSVTYV